MVPNSLGGTNRYEGYPTRCSNDPLHSRQHVEVTLSCGPSNTDQRGPEVGTRKRETTKIIHKKVTLFDIGTHIGLKTLRKVT